MTIDKRLALVTGGNRGLGLETCRQLAESGHRVVLGARDVGRGQAAAASLANHGLRVYVVALDVADDGSVASAIERIRSDHGRVEILVNNAAVALDNRQTSIAELSTELLEQTLAVNLVGALRVIQCVLPHMRANGWGRIVQVSSGLGALHEMGAGSPAYRMSKSALNAMTRIVHAECHGSGIKINAISPGWVRTDMGGPHADRAVDEGARGIVWAATLPDDGPSGGFFRDQEAIPW